MTPRGEGQEPGTRGDESVTLWRHTNPNMAQPLSLEGPHGESTYAAKIQWEPVDFVPRTRLERAEATEADLRRYLWECAAASGEDLSGVDGPEHGVFDPASAVESVKELRADYDECPAPEDLAQAESHLSECESRIEAVRKVSDVLHMLAHNFSPGDNIVSIREKTEELRAALTNEKGDMDGTD